MKDKINKSKPYGEAFVYLAVATALLLSGLYLLGFIQLIDVARIYAGYALAVLAVLVLGHGLVRNAR